MVKKQFSKTNTIQQTPSEDETPNPKAQNDRKTIEDYITNNSNQSQNLSCWNDHIGDMKDSYRNRPLRCFAYIMEGGTCMRANTMQAYCELNRQISSLLPTLSHNQLAIQMHPNANVQPKAQVSYSSDFSVTKILREIIKIQIL